MRKRKTLAPLPPITDFESCQRVRPMLLHRVGDLLEVWRDCRHAACARAKSCRRGDGQCWSQFMGKQPESFRRLFNYSLQNRLAGLDPAQAVARAQARVDEETARVDAEMARLGL